MRMFPIVFRSMTSALAIIALRVPVLAPLELLILEGLAFFPSVAAAGWVDRAPVSINGSSNPVCDVHANSGGRRIVRINNTIIAICPNGTSERTWRSTDNGASWTEIDADGTYSGCLITGKDSTVYHFYVRRNGTTVTSLHMVKFRYNGTPAAPVAIYAPNATSKLLAGLCEDDRYHMLNATVDSAGRLYVASHWDNPDRVYVLTSADFGETWSDPYLVSAPTPGCCYYVHLEVSTRNVLYATYRDLNGGIVKCGRSTDNGRMWTVTTLPLDGIDWNNPALLTIGADTLFVCAQHENLGLYGCFSFNQGTTWQPWYRLERTSGYADPSAGLADNGDLYVAFRGDRNRSSGDYRSRLIRKRSADTAWVAVDSFYSAPYEVGCRNQIRYQTWWNYGGSLEWIWMQRNSSDAGADIWYDRNDDVHIKNIRQDPPTTGIRSHGPSAPGQYVIEAHRDPFNPSITIKIHSDGTYRTAPVKIFDMQGNHVCSLQSSTVNGHSISHAWDVTGQATGTYFVATIVNGLQIVKRINIVN